MAHAAIAASDLASGERGAWRTALGIALVGVAVYAVMPTMPLYSENQNTKFLYGLAKAGVGRLSDDWLIGQGSELPIFDTLVYFTAAFAGEWAFYLWHLAATVAYAAAVYGIARIVGLTHPDRLGTSGRWFLPIFGLWFVGLHATNVTVRLFEGVANQYVQGPTLEPQLIGVLALLSLLLFRLGQAGWAVALIVAAAWVHPTYSIAGLMILGGFCAARWRFGEAAPLPPLVLAGGILGCLAAAAFAYSLLQPSDAAVQAEALRIITEIRIPDHSRPQLWFKGDSAIKLLAVVLAVWVARRDPLGWVLMAVTLAIVALTLWVWLAGDMALALAAPWRASAIVTPAANAILLGRLIQTVAGWASDNPWRRKAALATAVVPLAVAIGFGVGNKLEFAEATGRSAYFDWVRETARDGDVFLTSIEDGSFRLATGQPQFVSWKTHPHRGEAVLEWYARTARARAVTETDAPSCEALEALAREGVTHLVREPPNGDPHCPGWNVVYDDGSHIVSRHRPAGK